MTPTPIREDEMVARLHAATAHGDQEHRDWLRDAYTAFFAGKPVPAPRGSGRKEKLIREQAARLTALSSERDLLREALIDCAAKACDYALFENEARKAITDIVSAALDTGVTG